MLRIIVLRESQSAEEGDDGLICCVDAVPDPVRSQLEGDHNRSPNSFSAQALAAPVRVDHDADLDFGCGGVPGALHCDRADGAFCGLYDEVEVGTDGACE